MSRRLNKVRANKVHALESANVALKAANEKYKRALDEIGDLPPHRIWNAPNFTLQAREG